MNISEIDMDKKLNKDKVEAAHLRKSFNRAHGLTQGDVVSIDGQVGEFAGISVKPGSSNVAIKLYETGAKPTVVGIDYDRFDVSVSVSDRPKVTPSFGFMSTYRSW